MCMLRVTGQKLTTTEDTEREIIVMSNGPHGSV